METIVLGADHAGYRLKEHLAGALRNRGYAVVDTGCYNEDSVDYPAIAGLLAEKIRQIGVETGSPPRGMLCCGSGIGIAMSANRFPWLRAVVAHDHYSAVMSRRHNDANVLCLGGRVVAPELAEDLLETWLSTPFEGDRHQKRVDMMADVLTAPQKSSGMTLERENSS